MNGRRAIFVDEIRRRFVLELEAGRIFVCDALGAPLIVLESPYGRGHLAELRFNQFRQVFVIVHPELHPRTLHRLGDRHWILQLVTLRDQAAA